MSTQILKGLERLEELGDVTKENLGNLSQQLWSIYFDVDKYNCIGLIELNQTYLYNQDKVDFDRKPPLAFLKLENLPEEEEPRLNILVDLSIISICPNIFLFLEAIHENKSDEIIDFHLNVFDGIQKFISEDEELRRKYPTLDRIHKPFKWIANKHGYIINQHGQKVVKFRDPNLARWVSMVAGQFHQLVNFNAKKKQANDEPEETEPMFSSMGGGGGRGGSLINGLNANARAGGPNGPGGLNRQMVKYTVQSYQELKQLNKDLIWNIHDNLHKMKIPKD